MLKENCITTSQWAVLKLLSEYDELTQAQIAERLYSDRATIGTVIDKLVEKNMVTKKMCKEDRRYFIINLLPEDKEKVIHLMKTAEESNNIALNDIATQDIEIFEKCLRKVISNLEQEVTINGLEV
jgi:DNA-binding MarR family transcriptional regulator